MVVEAASVATRFSAAVRFTALDTAVFTSRYSAIAGVPEAPNCAFTEPCTSSVPLDPLVATLTRNSKVNCPFVTACSAAVVMVASVTVPSFSTMVEVGVPVPTVNTMVPEMRSARLVLFSAPASRRQRS